MVPPAKNNITYSDDEEGEDVDEAVDRNALNDNENEEEDLDTAEIDEEDSFDDDNIETKRKRKSKRSQFVETEALVGDEEEEEEEDLTRRRRKSRYEEVEEEEEDFIEDDEDELLEAQQTYSRLLAERRTLPHPEYKDDVTLAVEAEEEARRIRTLYGRSSEAAARAAAAEDGLLPETFLAPTVQDPKLWMVRCRPGKERTLAFQLMRRFIETESGTSPRIFSIVVREPHLKGFVYIEAFTKQDVLSFCERIPNIWLSSPVTLVPIHEMPDVLRMPKHKESRAGEEAAVRAKDWVKIKRGRYANDIAMVLDVTEEVNDGASGRTARLRLVPRLTLFGEREGRPSRRHFNPVEVAERSRVVGISGPSRSASAGYWMYGGEYFKDGFLEKEIRLSGIEVLSTPPTLSEIETFMGGSADAAEIARQVAASTLTAEVAAMGPLCRVEVMEGELRGAIGIVRELNDGGETALIAILLNDTERILHVPISALRPRHEVGDAVRVLRGTNTGAQGLVTRVDGSSRRVTIFLSAEAGEIEVLARDLGPVDRQDASEVLLKKTAQFSRGNLVLLSSGDGRIPGIITVAYPNNSYAILDARSQAHASVRGASLRRLSPAMPGSLMDAFGVPLSLDSTVRVQNGPCQGYSGKIIAMYKGTLWMQLIGSEKMDIVAIRSSCAALIGARGEIVGAVSPVSIEVQQQRRNVSAAARWRNKTISISAGPYKGLTGLVKEVQQQTLFVELHTSSKLVGVPLTAVLDPVSGAAPHIAGRQDRPGFATPGYATPGFTTPAGLDRHGWRTPAAAGFRTPASGNQFDIGSRTPAIEKGFRTPAFGTAAAGDGWRTPSSISASSGGFLGRPMAPSSPWTTQGIASGAASPWSTPHAAASGGVSPWMAQAGATSPWRTPGNASPWNAAGHASPWMGSEGTSTPASVSPWGSRDASGRMGAAAFDAAWARPFLEVILLNDKTSGCKATVMGFEQSGGKIPISFQSEDNDQQQLVDFSQLALSRPQKKDHCVVLAGDNSGTTGTLVGIDGADAIVRVDASQKAASGFIIVPALVVGKLVQ